uniref:Putative RNA-directed DNA polymerase n=1 Tax=Schizaphis graminum TaxID=13262 RepID=A0A2S2P698_SCHGA
MSSPTSNSLLILLFNANGLKNHQNELQVVLQEKRIDIALISETHFTKYSHIPITGYNLLKTNHPDNTAHGGAAIYIKASLVYQTLPNFCQPNLQSCAILMHLNNVPTTISAIYSPPRHNMNFQNYTDYFSTLSHNFIIGGDYNAKHNSWGCRTNNPRGNILHHFITQKGFKVLAPPGPTYWPTSLRKKPDILDIFVSNTPSNIYYTTSNLLEPSSDHSAVLLTVSAAPPIRPCPPKLFHATTDKQKFHDLVNQNINLKIRLKTTQEIDDAINKFTNIIQTAAWDASTTHRQHTNHSPSIPEYIRILIANKRRARALYQRHRLPSLKRNFNNLANSLKKILSSHKNQAQANYLANLSSKDGSLWLATKKSLQHQAPNTPLINPSGGLASSDADKAELLKNHLAKIFTPHSDIQIPHHTALVNRFLDSPIPPSIPLKYFTPSDIKNAIQNYSLKKSPGYDLITAEVAKCLPKRAIVLLTVLINASLRLAYFPQLWKFSIIIVFPKPKKPPDILSSYRPISLLPFLAKIFERLILKRILPYIFTSNIIPNTQFGFRASHSTTHQLHRLVDAISFSLEKKKYCSCVFLDVSQAFDRVWHEGLLFKLKAFLPPTYFLLIKSYLTDRHFQVKFGSSFSSIEKISAGVPQGGILSPILYNVYAADQPTSPTTSVAEFADDKAIISIHEDSHIASLNLQNHLNLMSIWYDKWRVQVNQSKSIHTTFTLRLPPCPEVSLSNIPIPSSQSVKYLGLTFDRRLTWGPHIRTKKLALNERLRSIKSLISNKHTKLNTKLLIYKSLIKPMWTYGLQLWGNAKVTNVNKIQTVQNKILRLITNAPPYVSNHTLHTDLNIKSVHAEAVTYYKRFHNRLPHHPNPLISNLASHTIPGNPTRRLKRNWCRDLLNE